MIVMGRQGFSATTLPSFHIIDRRSVHTRGLAGHLGGAAKRPAHSGREFFAGSGSGHSFHGDLSNNFGVLAQLSYTL